VKECNNQSINPQPLQTTLPEKAIERQFIIRILSSHKTKYENNSNNNK